MSEERYTVRRRHGRWWVMDTGFTPADPTDYAYDDRRLALAKAGGLNAADRAWAERRAQWDATGVSAAQIARGNAREDAS